MELHSIISYCSHLSFIMEKEKKEKEKSLIYFWLSLVVTSVSVFLLSSLPEAVLIKAVTEHQGPCSGTDLGHCGSLHSEGDANSV